MKCPAIRGFGTALPELEFTQEEVFSFCKYPDQKFAKLFRNSGVEKRRLFFDSKNPRLDETPDELNARYLRGALQLAQDSARKALESADISPEKIDLIVTTSCTGYLCPDLATRLVKPLELRSDVQRVGIQGMGCGGAMPALQRASDFVLARGGLALVIAVEICSAAYDLDNDPETAVGNALCSDGAAAVILGLEQTGKLQARVKYFHSRILPEHLEKVGFSMKDGHLRIVLKESVRELAPSLIAEHVRDFLSQHSLEKNEIQFWAIHPGGSRILDQIPKALGLPSAAFQASAEVLKNFGNMSSPTVLFVLEKALQLEGAKAGDKAILLALGPGFASEIALVEWA